MEQLFFQQLWNDLSAKSSDPGKLSGDLVSSLFRRSKPVIADNILGSIWKFASGKQPFLDQRGFFLALRLLSCAQHHIPFDSLAQNTVLPLPRFEGIVPPDPLSDISMGQSDPAVSLDFAPPPVHPALGQPQQAMPQQSQHFQPHQQMPFHQQNAHMGPQPVTPAAGAPGTVDPTWILSDAEKQGYIQVNFPQADLDHDGFLSGKDAMEYFTKSRLDQSILVHVCRLADVDRDKRLNPSEFAVAMFLISRARKGLPLPPQLPEPLVAAATGAPYHPAGPAPHFAAPAPISSPAQAYPSPHAAFVSPHASLHGSAMASPVASAAPSQPQPLVSPALASQSAPFPMYAARPGAIPPTSVQEQALQNNVATSTELSRKMAEQEQTYAAANTKFQTVSQLLEEQRQVIDKMREQLHTNQLKVSTLHQDIKDKEEEMASEAKKVKLLERELVESNAALQAAMEKHRVASSALDVVLKEREAGVAKLNEDAAEILRIESETHTMEKTIIDIQTQIRVLQSRPGAPAVGSKMEMALQKNAQARSELAAAESELQRLQQDPQPHNAFGNHLNVERDGEPGSSIQSPHLDPAQQQHLSPFDFDGNPTAHPVSSPSYGNMAGHSPVTSSVAPVHPPAGTEESAHDPFAVTVDPDLPPDFNAPFPPLSTVAPGTATPTPESPVIVVSPAQPVESSRSRSASTASGSNASPVAAAAAVKPLQSYPEDDVFGGLGFDALSPGSASASVDLFAAFTGPIPSPPVSGTAAAATPVAAAATATAVTPTAKPKAAGVPTAVPAAVPTPRVRAASVSPTAASATPSPAARVAAPPSPAFKATPPSPKAVTPSSVSSLPAPLNTSAPAKVAAPTTMDEPGASRSDPFGGGSRPVTAPSAGFDSDPFGPSSAAGAAPHDPFAVSSDPFASASPAAHSSKIESDPFVSASDPFATSSAALPHGAINPFAPASKALEKEPGEEGETDLGELLAGEDEITKALARLQGGLGVGAAPAVPAAAATVTPKQAAPSGFGLAPPPVSKNSAVEKTEKKKGKKKAAVSAEPEFGFDAPGADWNSF